MKEVKKEAKAIPVFWDRPADSDIDKDIEIALKEGFESIVINHKGITKTKVDKVHEAGFEVGAWTVNEPGTMKTLLDIGVYRIYTDDPRTLFKILENN
jgi:glycerophosphoryl diester phosphodiesterase